MTDLHQHHEASVPMPADIPAISPELIAYHVRRGRQLRAQATRQGASAAWRWLATGFGRSRPRARISTRHAH